MDEHSSAAVATAAPIVALTLLLVVGAIALGWLAMWRLVLSKIPVLRAMCGLQQLVPDIKKQS